MRRTTAASALALACISAACSASGGPEVAGVTTIAPVQTSSTAPEAVAPPAPAPAPTTTSTLPTTTTLAVPTAQQPFVPPATDVLLERKQLGGQFAQAVLTYNRGATVESHIESLRQQFGFEPDDETQALLEEAMRPGAVSVGRVRYAQMGGNRATKASLMVWVDQDQITAEGDVVAESRVVDVRVRLDDDQWVIDRLASAGGPSIERPDDLSELALSVVDHPSISMPDSARWDIYAGHTTDAMLNRMLEVAEIVDYSVLVLNRGHPYHVFATQSVSRHSVGQAMDVYEVGGEFVVNSRFEGSATWTLARELYDRGTRSIGSPWAFDGFGGRSFTDDVHQDHLHITSL